MFMREKMNVDNVVGHRKQMNVQQTLWFEGTVFQIREWGETCLSMDKFCIFYEENQVGHSPECCTPYGAKKKAAKLLLKAAVLI